MFTKVSFTNRNKFSTRVVLSTGIGMAAISMLAGFALRSSSRMSRSMIGDSALFFCKRLFWCRFCLSKNGSLWFWGWEYQYSLCWVVSSFEDVNKSIEAGQFVWWNQSISCLNCLIDVRDKEHHPPILDRNIIKLHGWFSSFPRVIGVDGATDLAKHYFKKEIMIKRLGLKTKGRYWASNDGFQAEGLSKRLDSLPHGGASVLRVLFNFFNPRQKTLGPHQLYVVHNYTILLVLLPGSFLLKCHWISSQATSTPICCSAGYAGTGWNMMRLVLLTWSSLWKALEEVAPTMLCNPFLEGATAVTEEDWSHRIKPVLLFGDWRLGLEASLQRLLPSSRCSVMKAKEVARVNLLRYIMAVMKTKANNENADALPLVKHAIYLSGS